MKPQEHTVNLYVGRKIRSLRTHYGWTQEKLAKELDVSFQQLQKYEQGENRVSAVKLFWVSQMFNEPLENFFPISL